MGEYREKLYQYSSGAEFKTIIVTYRQPAWRHWIAVAYAAWVRASFPVMRRLDAPLDRLHGRYRCDDDCRSPWFDRDGKHTEPECTYLPVTCRQDLREYQLRHVDRVPS